ncbi:hypothetical protein BOW44_12525 [Solemya velum gill symbiont]|uniref:class I SAM-dependent methyltransferase n=1 Tax=Solemya velum gill symbiont TaxID=2340 RepID=UPI0009986476|nr:class I SAM-dependent methyltransferase [Solemya velum gill symbiont]OOZ59048.1 hypothetical protein BOW44_12525 [Solemya velum gill symbiont]
MNKQLIDIFNDNKAGKITKWNHYFDIYEEFFSRYRGSDVRILEFGVFQGGSLKMWREYFGDNCTIYGVDINDECKKFEENGIEIFIGDQEDRGFLKEIAQKIGTVDIVIDDGGHTMKQQINTFEEIFPSVDKDGIYLVEDLHTSYWPDYEYGGGYKNKKSFIEYSKNFIDYINAWQSKSVRLNINKFTESVESLHYYDSVLVIKKKMMSPHMPVENGKVLISEYKNTESSIPMRIKRKIYNILKKDK